MTNISCYIVSEGIWLQPLCPSLKTTKSLRFISKNWNAQIHEIYAKIVSIERQIKPMSAPPKILCRYWNVWESLC